MLWALGVLLLPVLIHLFHLRWAKRLDFSHVPMLREVVHITHTRSKLRRRVLLLLRMLGLACVVLAFAQPYWPSTYVMPRSHRVLIYVDNSYSMSNFTTSEQTALDAGLYLARQIVQTYDPQTQFFLLSNEFSALRPRLRDETLDLLSKIDYSTHRRLALGLQRRLQPLLAREKKPMDLYWISDFQANLFADKPLMADSLHNWHIIPIQGVSTNNLFVDTVYSASPAWMARQPNRLCVRIQNMRDVPCTPCTVKLFIEGVQHALQTIKIDAQGYEETCFEYTPETLTSARVYVQIDDPVLRFDNNFYAVLTAAPPVSITEIADAAAPGYIKQAYVDNPRFRYRRYLLSNLPYERLYTQDLVVLHALPQLPTALGHTLQDMLSRGASLMIIPPSEATIETYTSLLPGFERSEAMPVPQPLATPNYEASFYTQVFLRNASHVAMPQATTLYHWYPRDLQSILQLVDKSPFLSRSTHLGQRYLLAAPLLNTYTDFMQHPIFVPTLYKIATQSQQRFEKLYYRTQNKHLWLPVTNISAQVPLFQLRTEKGTLQALSAQRRGQQYALFFSEPIHRPGFYSLEQDSKALMWIAFNVPAAESDLRYLESKSLATQIAPLQKHAIIEASNSRNPYASFLEKHRPRLLWSYFLVAALLCFCAEIVYLRYMERHGTGH